MLKMHSLDAMQLFSGFADHTLVGNNLILHKVTKGLDTFRVSQFFRVCEIDRHLTALYIGEDAGEPI